MKCKTYDKFTTETVFNPGTSAPFNFYLESIDLETSLRNQHIRKDKLSKNFGYQTLVIIYIKVMIQIIHYYQLVA